MGADLGVGVDLGKGVGVDLGIGVGFDLVVGVDLGTGVGVDVTTGVGVDLGSGVGVDLGKAVQVGWCIVEDFRYSVIVAVIAVIVLHFLLVVPKFFQLKVVCFHAFHQSFPLIPLSLFAVSNKR